jgi:hypothetical protein
MNDMVSDLKKQQSETKSENTTPPTSKPTALEEVSAAAKELGHGVEVAVKEVVEKVGSAAKGAVEWVGEKVERVGMVMDEGSGEFERVKERERKER